jgi:hypothetical protein
MDERGRSCSMAGGVRDTGRHSVASYGYFDNNQREAHTDLDDLAFLPWRRVTLPAC